MSVGPLAKTGLKSYTAASDMDVEREMERESWREKEREISNKILV